MDDVRSTNRPETQFAYDGLRDWIEKVDGMGELLRVDKAHWDTNAILFTLTRK